MQKGRPRRVFHLQRRPPPREAAEIEAKLQQAVAWHREGRLDDAEAVYRAVVRRMPRHHIALHLLGVIAAQRRQYEDAVRLIGEALEVEPDFPEALSNLGNALRQLGRAEEALARYDEAVALNPGYFEAHSNRGNVLRDLKRPEEAIASFDRALAIKPDYAEALFNRAGALAELRRFEDALKDFDRALALRPDHAESLSGRGNALMELGRPEEALASYDRALGIRPDYPEALSNRGNALAALRRLDEALESFERALKLRPSFPEALSNRGNALTELGRFEEALESFDAALALRPEHAPLLSNRGNALIQMDRFEDALASYEGALKLRPGYAEALSNRGNALTKLDRYEEALADYDAALAIRPDYPEALSNRGNALNELKRFEEALASYDRALRLRPDYPEAYSNRGNTLRDMRRLDEALASFDKALAIRPDYPEALCNRGNVLKDLKRIDEALESYKRASEVRPGYAEAIFNEGLCRLLAGDFETGWRQYEWRWRRGRLARLRRDFAEPQWQGGSDIAGKTILLHAEQGMGDTIQFCRYVPMVAALGAKVVLEVQAPLVALLQGLDGAERVVARGEALPALDLQSPLLSLPFAFETRMETIPATVPYLSAPPERLAAWEKRLAALPGPRVGLAWAGNPDHRNDHNRSLASEALKPLLGRGASLIGLQKDQRPEDRRWLAAHPDVHDLGHELRDFSDTAAVISLLDVVVSVDTSVAHLAGALGKAVWILVPYIGIDWRWQLERTDSPWYPTARLFREPAPDSWAPVIAEIGDEIARLPAPGGR